MKRIGIILSIIIVTGVFIYSLIILSSLNTCSGVRSFDCEKANTENIVTGTDYDKLKKTGDLFLSYCIPIIRDENSVYSLDYSNCNLKISILKDKPWVENVNVNGTNLTRDEINNKF